jgi:type II secretory pathway component PulF
MEPSGKMSTGVLDVGSAEEAGEELRARGLFVTQISETKEADRGSGLGGRLSIPMGRPGNVRDLLMFSQQVAMMLRAGSRVVPALEAIEDQITKPAWRKIVTEIRERVETGSPLSAALAHYPNIFDETWLAIIGAAESTGRTDEAFTQLAAMTKEQQQIRVRIIGTLTYPLVLMLLSVGVISLMLFFVLPRFSNMYEMLNTPLPWITSVLLVISQTVLDNQLLFGGGAIACLIAAMVVLRTPQIVRRLTASLTFVPLVGTLMRHLVLAKVFRIWGTSVVNGVPLLDCIKLSSGSTRNVLFQQLLNSLMERIADGDSIGLVLMQSPLVPRTMASAVATGEQSGQLGQSLLFLADYLDHENSQMLASVTRLVEPMILIFMGVGVGIMAISMFLPLFDLTSAM